MDIGNSVSLFVEIIKYVLPFVFVFTMGTVIVNMIIRSATGGRLEFY